MEVSQTTREKSLRNAEILQFKTELPIETCSDWLSAEEGSKNMERNIRERDKRIDAQSASRGRFLSLPFTAGQRRGLLTKKKKILIIIYMFNKKN